MAIADLSAVRGVLFDLDGVVYLGKTPLPGAQGVFDWLDQVGRPYCLVTNNSTRTPIQYQAGLLAMGIHVPIRTVYTSALATAEYLKRQYPRNAAVYVIGEAGLEEALAEAGFWTDERRPDLVCVGLDQHLTYDKLKIAALAIRRGARFIAANPDRTLPTEVGLVPGCGAILAALETATDVAPVVVGKPAATMLDLAIERLGVPKSEVVIIGDRLDTDIEAGAAAGITTVMVLTGVHRVADIAKFPVAPNYVVDDLIEFRAVLAGERTIPRYDRAAGVP